MPMKKNTVVATVVLSGVVCPFFQMPSHFTQGFQLSVLL